MDFKSKRKGWVPVGTTQSSCDPFENEEYIPLQEPNTAQPAEHDKTKKNLELFNRLFYYDALTLDGNKTPFGNNREIKNLNGNAKFVKPIITFLNEYKTTIGNDQLYNLLFLGDTNNVELTTFCDQDLNINLQLELYLNFLLD